MIKVNLQTYLFINLSKYHQSLTKINLNFLELNLIKFLCDMPMIYNSHKNLYLSYIATFNPNSLVYGIEFLYRLAIPST